MSALPYASSVQNAASVVLAALAVTGWCAWADELGRRAHAGLCSRWHAPAAWALAAVSALAAAAYFVPAFGACPR